MKIKLSVLIFCLGVTLSLLVCASNKKKPQIVSLSTLMDEMVSAKTDACFPIPYYTSKQQTSYDRRSVIPNTPSWHANDDWSGFIRYEANNGRVEKVLFDELGPGVLTRIVTTGGDKDTNLRIYFDGETEASITIPSYDISRFPISIPAGMIYMHEHYATTQGCSFYYPIPYGKRCKITVDNLNRPYVYHVNYRTYEPDTKVRTFTIEEAKSMETKAKEISDNLLNPKNYTQGEVSKSERLLKGKTLSIDLPQGTHAIRTLSFSINQYNKIDYAQLMRGLIVKITFDGVQTVRVPLSDFCGAGMGAPSVNSWYLTADGTGKIDMRYVMPYKKNATIELENITDYETSATVKINISDWEWHSNTLYFHAGWRQENGLKTNEGIDYCMANLSGRGVFKGDVLSLYNYTPRWYGEGDEHIWVDDDTFPSHFGCGTEDYYNTTYAPIHVYHNPYGGAPREDNEESKGYNTFLRTRNLDAIPFKKQLKFEFELISWDKGFVDYSSTVYWYGDLDSKMNNRSSDDAALYILPSVITDNN